MVYSCVLWWTPARIPGGLYLHFRNAQILDIGWLFRSISSITVTLHNSLLESFDWNEGVARFPEACLALPTNGPSVHVNNMIDDVRTNSELAITLLLLWFGMDTSTVCWWTKD